MSGYGFTSAGTIYDDEDRLTGYARANGSLNQSWNLTTVGDWTSVTTNGTSQSRTEAIGTCMSLWTPWPWITWILWVLRNFVVRVLTLITFLINRIGS
jgi:hypothetical protein